MFTDPVEWLLLARALGYEPHAPVAGYGTLASFRHLKRAMGPRSTAAPSFATWLYGVRGGVEGIVLHYATGSGRSRRTWTAAIARLDPPLFIGASICAEAWLSDLFGGADVQLGVPAFDAELRLGALDPQRLRALLWPHDAEGTQLLQALVRGTRAGMHVTDSTVAFQLSGLVTDAAQVAGALDEAAWVAAALGRRRAALAPSPGEAAIQGEWRAFADSMNLSFDPAHMRIEGEVRGTHVQVALETNGGRVQTAVAVRWPRALEGTVRVRKAGALAFLTELFGGDIKTGDRAFDDAFAVQGHPEPWVRHVFASQVLRDTLRGVAAFADEVTFDQEGAFWLWPVPAVRASDLDGHVTTALRASEAIFGAIEGVGPYR